MVSSHSSFELFELELDLHDVHVTDSECLPSMPQKSDLRISALSSLNSTDLLTSFDLDH